MSARRTSHRIRIVVALAAAVLAGTPTGRPVEAQSETQRLTADLDGQPIELSRVGTLHCHDLDSPRIHCFATEAALDAAVSPQLVAAGVSYVRIFENPLYGGASMYLADDYQILAGIGWNDRISSFKAVNSEAGIFYVDWFYGGGSSSFCCNQSVASLGAFNDAFSSVRRT